jgi:hypothetical protein
MAFKSEFKIVVINGENHCINSSERYFSDIEIATTDIEEIAQRARSIIFSLFPPIEGFYNHQWNYENVWEFQKGDGWDRVEV